MSRNAIRASLAGLTLVLSAGAVVAPSVAAPASDAPAAESHKEGRHGHGFHHGHRRGPMMERGGLFIPGLGPLSKAQIDALKLTDAQKKLAEEARTTQRELFKNRFKAGAERHALLDKQLAAGKLDPRALTASSDAERQQFHDRAGQVREKWLAVWDSLDEAQRKQVTDIVKARQDEMKARHEKMQERMKSRAAS